MAAKMIEHRGIVQRLEGGKALVVMETAGCAACGQGSTCGVGKMAAGRPATLLSIPVSDDVRVGDLLTLGLPENQLTLSALLGYLFPAMAMLVGAALGSYGEPGSDAATALGAMAGFFLALVLTRISISLLPGLLPSPQLISRLPPNLPGLPRHSTPFPKEHDHD